MRRFTFLRPVVVVVLLGVLGGAMAFGVIGIFLGPTLLAVGYTVVRDWTLAAPVATAAPGLTHRHFAARRQGASEPEAPASPAPRAQPQRTLAAAAGGRKPPARSVRSTWR